MLTVLVAILVEASGRSKIEAKQAAAKDMVDDFAGCEISWEFYYGKKGLKYFESTTKIIVPSSPESASTLPLPSPSPGSSPSVKLENAAVSSSSFEYHSRVRKILSGFNYRTKNFVGLLHEYSQLKGIESALFELESESGEPHQKVFSVSCTLEDLAESGSGKSMKEAKKKAAEVMWRLVEAKIVNGEHNE